MAGATEAFVRLRGKIPSTPYCDLPELAVRGGRICGGTVADSVCVGIYPANATQEDG